MGAAVCGMHYTGMEAAIFTHDSHVEMASTLNPAIMAVAIAGVTFVILGIAFVASTYKESINQQLLLTARQAGMAEVAASVLHNVGNVLNSVNVSSNILAEKIDQSKLSGLTDLSKLLQQYKNNLSQFIQNDPRGSHLPDFIDSLSNYWRNEQEFLQNELKVLTKNVNHIKSIIATQQDLSRVSQANQVVSIENVLEESILISGVDDPKFSIQIEKEYDQLKPVLVDKVKLLQILVNLIQNAKESLIETNGGKKSLALKIKKNNTHFIISVADNGKGIAPENLTRVFAYGFTTKTYGHGFGLHTSANSAKEMEGNLKVESKGLGRGATFILVLPYKYH